MSPRIIHMPLSGGDRKAQAKAQRDARFIAREFFRQSVVARSIGELKIREADRLFCDAWTNVVFWGGVARESPTIGQAINGGRPLLWAKCRRCGRESDVDLREVRRKPQTPVHLLEDKLFCDPCSTGRKFRIRSHLLGLKEDTSGPEHRHMTAT
jgi:hypothetical protein